MDKKTPFVKPKRKAGEKKRGKKYRTVAGKLDRQKLYGLEEAVTLLAETSTTKFDSSAEVHMNLGVDPKHADQIVRGTLAMPNGTGKNVKVIAFVDEGKVKECKAAGASEAGSADLVDKIAKGWLDFEVAIASPDQMKNLGKIAKTLGQKGLMPNPKAGTVTPDPAKTIEEIKKGRIEYKTDKEGNLHNIFGKVSFGADKLLENLKSYLKAVREAKPAGVKGNYVRSLTITTTMGPGVKVEPSEIYKQ
ncbi:MAG: 50S ribosomal protein L1 [Candidatus Gracilibacteria bacterium]|nr:50S ribosomal protein L1 [bacterium]MDZ4217202.1 50S ribosomal protein L1 [Candidatus Gracilibacteria bacterium]